MLILMKLDSGWLNESCFAWCFMELFSAFCSDLMVFLDVSIVTHNKLSQLLCYGIGTNNLNDISFLYFQTFFYIG